MKSKLDKHKIKQQTASDVLSLVDLSKESRAVMVGVIKVHLTHVEHRRGWRASRRRWRRSTTCSKSQQLEIFKKSVYFVSYLQAQKVLIFQPKRVQWCGAA
jgi:hypothetical protein